MPQPSLRAQVARSLDMPGRALDLAPLLLADLEALGSSPRRVANWLAGERLGRRARVLDLGCGKGAAAVAVARKIGCGVVGIDAYEPFIDSARVLAARRGVSRLCEFVVGDARRPMLKRRARFDAVLMLGLWPAARAAREMRCYLKPGGFLIIDDAVAIASPHRDPSDETAADLRAAFNRLGFILIREHIMSRNEFLKLEGRIQRRLSTRARELARFYPAKAGALRELMSRQREAVAKLSGPLRGAMWMLRRA